MVQNPPENTPRITPYLLYEDVEGALTWLSKAFGFRERLRVPGPEGKLTHAEMELDDGVIMMGWPGPDYRNPKQLGQVTHHVYIYVNDVDQHFAQAQSVGATILEPPEDQFYGDRRYGAEDPEGHHWYFAQHVRDIALEDMEMPT
jgi:PhnB protein